MCALETLNNLNVLGLVYDGVGVTVLGIPFLLESAEDTYRESGTYWDSNDPLMQRMARTKFDTAAGSVLLITGFALQLFAALKIEGQPWVTWPLWGMVALLPIGYFYVWRKRLVIRYVEAVKKLTPKG